MRNPLATVVFAAFLVSCGGQPPVPAARQPTTAVVPTWTAPAPPPPCDGPPPVVRELVRDGGFEAEAPGPWSENNWAKNEVEFVRDGERPYRGRCSQRMRLIRAGEIRNLQLVQRLEGAHGGEGLLVRLALRGGGNAVPITAEIRRTGAPWTVYGGIRIPPTAEWQVSSFSVTLPAVLPEDGVGVFIHLNDENVVWIDEVSVGVLPAVDPRGPLAGNLVANGSFEAGLARWIASDRAYGPLARIVEVDNRFGRPSARSLPSPEAPAGRRVLRFTVQEAAGIGIDSAYFPFRHGHPLSASLRARAVRGSGLVELSLGSGEMPNTVWLGRAAARLDQSWQTISFTATPGPLPGGIAFAQISSGEPGEYEVDDVRVEQAPATVPAPAVFGCAVADPPPGSLFRPGESPRLELCAAGLAAGARRNALLRVQDAWERTVAELPVAFAADAAGAATATCALPADRFGGFHCALEVDGRLEAEAVYCLVPPLPKPDGSGRSFFGGHFNLSPYGLDKAERCGMRWLRLHPPLDTKWAAAEPEQGKRAFHTAGVERAIARGFSVLGSLDAPPEWAALPGVDKPYAWWHNRPPRDWAQWTGYVQDAIRAYPGIRHWEIYNEPDCDFLVVPPGVDKVAAYVEILARTRQAAEAMGARVELVGLPVSSLDRPFFRQVIAKGGAAEVDALSFHFYYEDLDPIDLGAAFRERLAVMRGARSRTGGAPAVWHTEGGIWIASAPSWLALMGLPRADATTQLDGAHTVVRTAVALKALGLKRHFHYAALNNGGQVWRTETCNLFDLDGSARPGAAAHAAMVWLLDDAEPEAMDTVAVGAADVRVARFRSPSRGGIRVAWSRTPVLAAQVPGLLDGVSEARDLMGNPLAGEIEIALAPVYLIGR